jgi:two-component system, OmpR family, phosphate regulon sensor histidine kinase PhoR
VNLVDNAVKYSDPGKTVTIESLKTSSEIVIKVVDQGCGIPKEHLNRVFERFYRVDKARSRKVGGTGLGLSIVRHIVNAHGGRITVESSPGRGSVFSIHLPTERARRESG